MLILSAGRGVGQVVAITRDHATEAAEVRIGPDGAVHLLDGANNSSAVVPAGEMVLLLFATLPSDSPPRAWLCLQDGRRLSGHAVNLDADRATLVGAEGRREAAALAEVTAVFFRATRPDLTLQPAEGTRIISTNGDVLNVSLLEWTGSGFLVEVNPGIDPIPLPQSRISAILWPRSTPAHPAASSPAEPSGLALPLIELRTGERLSGRITSLDRQTLVVRTGADGLTIARREVEAIWFSQPKTQALEEVAPAPAVAMDRPRYCLGRNALGGVLQMGSRLFRRGLGMRGPASLEIPVPPGARWLVTQAGVDAGAAASARVDMEIQVDDKVLAACGGMGPGVQPRRMAVPVSGAAKVIFTVRSSGRVSAGCLGDFADAYFIH